jgi:NADP-dependent 3-hydroxy acid dehydrogenase YdfG
VDGTTSKSVIITGAGRGIGRALALRLAAAGARLTLAARTLTEIEGLAAELRAQGGQAVAVGTDVTEAREVQNMVGEAKAQFGRVDAVYYGAGLGVLSGALDLKAADLDRMWETNLKGLLYTAQAAIPLMVADGGGHFVVPVGILGRHVMRNSAGYSASKFAVVGLLRALGEEYNRRGLRFTMLYFGGVDTSFWDSIDMKVDRSKMITAAAAAEAAAYALLAPGPAVVNEIVMQSESHQFI